MPYELAKLVAIATTAVRNLPALALLAVLLPAVVDVRHGAARLGVGERERGALRALLEDVAAVLRRAGGATRAERARAAASSARRGGRGGEGTFTETGPDFFCVLVGLMVKMFSTAEAPSGAASSGRTPATAARRDETVGTDGP